MLQLRDQWLSLGGTASPLGSPVKPPAWASSIAPANTLEQQPTTGDHDGQVLFFQNGLIYWRDGLVGQNGSSAPLVMVYDMPAMGFDTSARFTSARFRLQLLDQFVDANGLVIVSYNLGDYKTHTGKSGLDASIPIADNPFVDTNDSAWMTGQALAAVSMANDMTSAALILRGMRDFEWSPTGDLLRYTGNTAAFKGLDPSTQIAGCYFAWKFAHAADSPVVQDLARSVIGKWVDELFRCNCRLGPGGPIMMPPGLITLRQAALRMGLDQTRLDHLALLLDGQKVATALVSLGKLSALAILDDATLYALCAAIEAGIDFAELGIPKWLRVQWKLQGPDDATPLDTSGLNLMFWANLVMHDCTPSALLNDVTGHLAKLTSAYGMMPFQWLSGDPASVHSSQKYVTDWSAAMGDTDTKTPSQGNYAWRTAERDGPGSETYNRVDYLVLRGLFNLDTSVWSHAPGHFGVSFDLPIPQLGSVHFSGSVNTNDTFSIAGKGSFTPFGFNLVNAVFTLYHSEVDNAGISVQADLGTPGWNVAHLAGSIDSQGGFKLDTSADLAVLGGPLASVLSGQVELSLDADGVTVDGKVGIPGVGGIFELHAAVHPDGSVEVHGIPGKFARFLSAEAALLWHSLGATASQIASALTNAGHTLRETAEALVHGAKEALDTTAQACRGIGRTASDVADALKPLAEGVDVHKQAENVRHALESAGYAAADVSEAMTHAFRGEIPHVDTPAVPHADAMVVPHADTPAGPHADAMAVPHADTPAGPHADAMAIPHADTPAGPHVDTPHNDGHPAHVDSHQDFGHWPHVDAHQDAPGPHVDVPGQDRRVPPHVDTPPQPPHADSPVPPHVDTPPQPPHVDTPVPPHVDTPPQPPHADSPVPPHVDTPPQPPHVDTPAQGHIDVP